MKDNFIINQGGKDCRCLLMELLGVSIDNLCYDENNDILNTKIVKKIIKDILLGLVDLHKKIIFYIQI